MDEIKKKFNEWKNSVVSPKNKAIEEKNKESTKKFRRAIPSHKSFNHESMKEEDEPICNDDDIDCEMDDEPYFDDSTEDKSFDFEDDEPIYWGD